MKYGIRIIIIARATRNQGAGDVNFSDSELVALHGNLDGSPLQQAVLVASVGATRWAENNDLDRAYLIGKRVKGSLEGSPKVFVGWAKSGIAFTGCAW